MAHQPNSRARFQSGVAGAAVGALILAAASTAGDMIWAAWITQHKMVYGVVHGALLFLVVGLFLGYAGGTSRSVALGAAGGPTAGLAAALSFYALAPTLGAGAMFVSWFGLWILLGLCHDRIAPRREGVKRAAFRGLAAAILSGLAFYAISGIWLDHSQPPNYFYNFACWSAAFFLAFFPLLFRRRQSTFSNPVGIDAAKN